MPLRDDAWLATQLPSDMAADFLEWPEGMKAVLWRIFASDATFRRDELRAIMRLASAGNIKAADRIIRRKIIAPVH